MFYKKYSKSSKMWLKEHFNDIYVKKSYFIKKRSRAWFKLEEINTKNNIFHLNMNVLDLGSAPGSWSEYILQKIGPRGFLVACDKLSMKPIHGIKFIQGDIQDVLIFNKLLLYNNMQVVLSDLSPNISGIKCSDIYNIMKLLMLSLRLTLKVLVPGGKFIVKAFENTELNSYIRKLKLYFSNVHVFKPNSSRARSREVYIIAIGKK